MKHCFCCSRLFFALACASTYTLFANLPYYRMLLFGNGSVCAKALLLSFVYACAISYGLSLFGRLGKVLFVLLAFTSGIVLYFSLMYGFAQNKEMFALLWNTNPHEALEYSARSFSSLPGEEESWEGWRRGACRRSDPG